MSFLVNLEFTILNFLQNTFKNPVIDSVMTFITKLGNNGFIWILVALIFLFTKKHKKTGIIILAGLLAGLVIGNLFLKNIFARLRPFEVVDGVKLLIPAPTDFSFPSGHTLSSFIAATILYKRYKKVGMWAILLAVLIAFSRLYLYVHFPSDVLFGALLGIFIGIGTNKIFTKNNKLKSPNNSI